jgi:hypothetical protein
MITQVMAANLSHKVKMLHTKREAVHTKRSQRVPKGGSTLDPLPAPTSSHDGLSGAGGCMRWKLLLLPWLEPSK